MLKQRVQKPTRSLTSTIDRARRWASSLVDLEQMERDPLRRLRADAGEPAEAVDQLLDGWGVRRCHGASAAEQAAEPTHAALPAEGIGLGLQVRHLVVR